MTSLFLTVYVLRETSLAVLDNSSRAKRRSDSTNQNSSGIQSVCWSPESHRANAGT